MSYYRYTSLQHVLLQIYIVAVCLITDIHHCSMSYYRYTSLQYVLLQIYIIAACLITDIHHCSMSYYRYTSLQYVLLLIYVHHCSTSYNRNTSAINLCIHIKNHIYCNGIFKTDKSYCIGMKSILLEQ